MRYGYLLKARDLENRREVEASRSGDRVDEEITSEEDLSWGQWMEKDAYARGLRFGGKQRKEIYKMDEGLPNIENREIIGTPSYYKKRT
jgi:hypothetical protein